MGEEGEEGEEGEVGGSGSTVTGRVLVSMSTDLRCELAPPLS